MRISMGVSQNLFRPLSSQQFGVSRYLEFVYDVKIKFAD